jgi:hypothetical protein
MSELKSRLLKENDWETLCKWWEAWPKWVSPAGLLCQTTVKEVL